MMTFFRTSMGAVCGILIALPAIAQETPVAGQTPVKEKKICRRVVPTGSMMGRSICLTKTEWAEFNRLNDEDADKALARRINTVPKPLL